MDQRIPQGVQAVQVTPPLKWAGGKRWLVRRIAEALSTKTERLIEPFAGSAAAFFYIQPGQAILADANAELINVYKCIRSDFSRIETLLTEHNRRHNHDYYYEMRAYRPRDAYRRAARTLYLNRTCWNALYRVNQRGEFNVPIGTKTAVLLGTDQFEVVSGLLKRASLRTADFVSTINMAEKGDLIFADPPYFCKSAKGTFVKYTKQQFSWIDQGRLVRALVSARKRGANFIVTNADTPQLAKLYAEIGWLTRVTRQSIISGPAKGRRETSELIWTSFPLDL